MRILTFVLAIFIFTGANSQVLKVTSNHKQFSIISINILNTCSGSAMNIKAPYIDLNSIECDTILISSSFYKSVKFVKKNCLSDTCIVLLEPMLFKLPEMSIVTDRIGTVSDNVMPGLKIIDGNELNLGSTGNTADALEENGVFVQKSQGAGGSPILRGFEANKILLTVDGIRMNNAIYRAGHLQNAISVPKAFLQKVEVLEGGGTVVHGSDALGGVISFRTLPLSFAEDEKSELGIDYSIKGSDSDSSLSGALILSGSKKNIAFLTGFSFDDFDNVRQGSKRKSKYSNFGERPWYVARINDVDTILINSNKDIQLGSAYSQFALMQKIGINTKDGSIHQLNLQYSKSSDADFYSRLTETDLNGKPVYSEWYYGPLVRALASYEYRKKTAYFLVDEILIGLNSQYVEESRHSRRYKSNNLDHRTESLYIQGLNIDLVKKHEATTIHYGTDLRFEQIKSKANRENILTKESILWSTRYPDGGSELLDLGIYTSSDHKINENYTATGGIRFNIYSLNAEFNDTTFFNFPFTKIESKNSSLSGNAGISYVKSDHWGSSLMIETGIRSPNLDDIAKVYDSRTGVVVMPNPDLQAERTLGPSLKFWKKISTSSKIELNAFYLNYDNIITYSPGTFLGADSIIYQGVNSAILTLQNKGEAYVTGGSLNMNFKLNELFQFYLSSTYTYGRIKTDSSEYPLDHIAPLFGKTGIRYSKQKIKLNADVKFQAAKLKKDYNIFGEDNFQSATPDGLPAWITYNFSAIYLLSSKLNFELGIDNILDTNYRTFASGISSPGRTLYFGLKGKF